MHKIYFSSSENMADVQDNSVQLMVTSPPYWDLKDYEVDNQIGYKEDYETYLGRLFKVWSETFRVLSDSGVAVININTKSFKKELVPIPFDFVKQMREIGYKFIDMHYWHKSSGIPRTNNLKDNFEYFLVFSKSQNPKINNTDFFDYKVEKPPTNTNIWNINKKFGSVGKKYLVHPAIFPVEYINRLIQIFTEEENIVLDPFLGSGTSLIAALNTKRGFIGFELNKEGYLPMVKDRLLENSYNFDEIMIFN